MTTYSLVHKKKQEFIHANQPQYGRNSVYPNDILNIINIIKPTTVLDYGCGQGIAGLDLQKKLHLDVRLYDPFVNKHNNVPVPADLVICWNVLNNVEAQYLSAVIADLYKLTNKDLIIKLPLFGSRKFLKSYTELFYQFNIKQLSKKLIKITTLVNGTIQEGPTTVLTVWLTKKENP